MTAREKRKLENVKEMVAELMDKVTQTYYVTDLSHEIEELYSALDLDSDFTSAEVEKLKKFGYKRVHNTSGEATMKYKGIPVVIEKYGYDNFSITFKEIRRKALYETYEYDVDIECLNPKSSFFKRMYSEYMTQSDI